MLYQPLEIHGIQQTVKELPVSVASEAIPVYFPILFYTSVSAFFCHRTCLVLCVSHISQSSVAGVSYQVLRLH